MISHRWRRAFSSMSDVQARVIRSGISLKDSDSENFMDPNEARLASRDADASAGPPAKSRSRWVGLVTPAVFVALIAAAYQLATVLNERARLSAGSGSGACWHLNPDGTRAQRPPRRPSLSRTRRAVIAFRPAGNGS